MTRLHREVYTGLSPMCTILKTMVIVLGMGIFSIGGCQGHDKTMTKVNNAHNAMKPEDAGGSRVDVEDLTTNGCPSQLFAKIQIFAHDDSVRVRDDGFKWSSRKLYHCGTDRGEYAYFMLWDGDYIQVNSREGIAAMSEILREYRFTRQYFDDVEEVHWFLETLVGLYGNTPGCYVGSSIMLRISEVGGGVSSWLQGHEKSEAVLRSLCCDPQFMFDGDRWKVVFNVFKPGGAVDQWSVAGTFDASADANTIYNIHIDSLKPKGTFSHWVYG